MEKKLFVTSEQREVMVYQLPASGVTDANRNRIAFFLHGLGGRAMQFEQQINDAAKSGLFSRCLAMDMVGHGESPLISYLRTTNQYCGFTSLVSDALHVLKSFGQDATEVVLIAHSYGTMIALEIASVLMKKNPAAATNYPIVPENSIAVRGLVLFGTSMDAPDRGGAAIHLPSFVLECLRPLARSDFVRKAFYVSTSKELIDRENEITGRNPMVMIKGFALGMQWQVPSCFLAPSSDPPLPPILAISGETDGVTSLEGAKKLIDAINNNDNNKRNRFEMVEKSSHNLMLEQPEKCSQLILQFLQTSVFA